MTLQLPAKERVIGVKQARKAISEGKAESVYVAYDADPLITDALMDLCKDHGIEADDKHTMSELGHACGIQVGASVVALLK